MTRKFPLLLLLVLTAFGFQTKAQNLEEIVKKHIEAIGGAENWKKVKSMKSVAKMNAQGAEVMITIYQVHEKAMKAEISVMGMLGYQILTNQAGWGYMPWGGQTKAEPLTAEDVKSAQDQLSILDEFLTYQAKGKKIELVGKDDVEGTECFKITMTDKDNKITTYYINTADYHIVKTTSKSTVNGKEMESTSLFSNYKKLDAGIVLAMNTNGDMGDMEITSVEVNPNIDENLFKPSN
jgi:hypothetical protein